ncbi:DUF2752 domain-containing protein [Mucilaginibacter sp.]|uniref:DUF2752 domain-containing protein n=1 Tax=Mucilaginibacter sp. TaxID=1882438 RepID=UPI002621BAE2|nr:DUF2752 domain-containing protein [Mucilaginibacter sp.]
MIKTIFAKYFELAFWIAGLVSLAITDPTNQSHFSLCPLKMLGITWCPGCGLGHSISFLFHGDLKSSLHAHWLGIPALIAILYRIYVLGRMRLFPVFPGQTSSAK